MKAQNNLKLLSESWIVNSEVSHYMTLNWSFFIEFQNYSTDVYLTNEKSIRVTEYGKAEVFVNEKRLTLSDVLYMSELNRNLLSIEAVSSHGITMKFWDKEAVFEYKESVIATVKHHSSAYILKLLNRKVTFRVQTYSTLTNKLTALTTAKRALPMLELISESVRAVTEHEEASVNDSAVREDFTSIFLILKNSDFLIKAQTEYQKWHQRFSHADTYWMKCLKSCVEGVKHDLHLIKTEKVCSVCLHSKMIWVQNKGSTSQTMKHLEQVYSDVWELYWEVSLSRNRYFMSFSDEFSWYSEIFLLEKRTDIYNIFEIWKLKAEKEMSEKLQIFWSDSAEKYRKLTCD